MDTFQISTAGSLVLVAAVADSPSPSALPEFPVQPSVTPQTEQGLPAPAVYIVGTSARERSAWDSQGLGKQLAVQRREQHPHQVLPRLELDLVVVEWT